MRKAAFQEGEEQIESEATRVPRSVQDSWAGRHVQGLGAPGWTWNPGLEMNPLFYEVANTKKSHI